MAAAKSRENAEYDVDYNDDRHRHYATFSSLCPLGHALIGMGLELAEIKDRLPLCPCSIHRAGRRRAKVAAPRSGC
jgi:hypothetical protein